MFRKYTSFLLLCAAACTASDGYIPVNSASLADEDVTYADADVITPGKLKEDAVVSVTPDNYAEPETPRAAQSRKVEKAAPAPAVIERADSSATKPEEPARIVLRDGADDKKPDAAAGFRAPPPDDFDAAVAEAEARQGITPEKKQAQAEKKAATRSSAIEARRQPADAAKPAANEKDGKKKLSVEPLPESYSVEFLSTVVYHSNAKSDMEARDYAALRNVVKLARAKKGGIRVVGHASSRTKNMKDIENKLENFDLSLERARRVRDELVRLGMPKDSVHLSAVSDTERVSAESMPRQEAANRRTEVYVRY
ncbi:MAG: OmpA family protein [Rickettsiales bacterium]|jgi:flagellar motor protein MotB|nr:OmpA family protein [Rickettsiales bacterium]